MAQSRKDSRGYALRTGECQRSDGRYSYSYVDKDRKRQVVYAPDLITLRKKEQQIRRDLEDGLDPRRAERVTVNQVYDSYIKGKYDLKADRFPLQHFLPGMGKRSVSIVAEYLLWSVS